MTRQVKMIKENQSQ